MSMLFQSLFSSGTDVPPETPETDPPDDECECESSDSGTCDGGTSGSSDGPVRYHNGEIQMSVTDLSTNGFGLPWGHTRVYCNQLGANGAKTSTDFGNGYNWLTKTTAYLIDLRGNDSEIQVVISPRQSFWFTLFSGVYQSSFGALQKLVHDTTNQVFRFNQTDGSVWQFYDFDQTAKPAGLLKSIVSPGGQSSLSFNYPNATSLVSEVERAYTVGPVTTIESFLYEYFPSTDPNAGLVASVTLRRKVGAGSWVMISRVAFTYYESSSTNGSSRDLQTSVHQLPNGSGGWTSIKTYYYRYYKDAAGGIGFAHGLKFVLEPEAFRLLSATTNPLTAADSLVAQYADFYYEYDGQQRVKLERIKAGSLTYSFTYTASSNPKAYNNWQMKTVETLPDGSKNIVYTNHIGQILLKDFTNSSNTSHWITYNQYDDEVGKVILNAMPSAVQNYNETANLGVPALS
jgi:hypothetical protein